MNDFGQRFQAALRQPSGRALDEFMLLGGRYSNFTKETYFLRCLSEADYDRAAARLANWQETGSARGSGYVFEPSIRRQPGIAETAKYAALYDQSALPFHFENRIWQAAFEQNFRTVTDRFKQERGCREDSIVRNFAIRLLYWIDLYFPRLFVETRKMNQFPKFACGGSVKLAEYLFLYLLFLMGCDVLCLVRQSDFSIRDGALLKLSLPVKLSWEEAPASRTDGSPAPRSERGGNTPLPLRPTVPAAPERPAPSSRVLDYEELAKLASSVVMLKVYDISGQCFKTGSGVIISRGGYVLTNFHVVSGGHRYGILLEDETDIFYTNELIKYHPDLDLAILRMEQRRPPIPIADSRKPLVRGQRVAAIGSPMGLFNSVSDGIISGFRTVGDVSMIQFTAPSSHGSSGGALLDLYGNLIGIITAGIDDGQNLNLAVDCKTISQFVRGFI